MINLNKIYKKLKIDLNTLFFKDEPILNICCKKDLENSVVWLLENNINSEIVNSLGESAIFYSIYSKDTKILNILLQHNANINHLNNKKRSLFQESISNSSNKIIRFLLQQENINITNIDFNDENILFDAIKNGNINIIKKIISLNKIDINHKNSSGNTILHLKNSLDSIDLALYLLNKGANPTIVNNQSKSYLFHCAIKGVDAIEFITRASDLGFDLNIKNSDNKNILMCAIDYFLNLTLLDKKVSQSELIKNLVHQKINLRAVDNQNETIFFNVTRSLDRDLIHYLLNNLEKLNLNKQNIDGLTVLTILILSGFENFDLIKLYIEKGADLEYKNKEDESVIEILINAILHLENQLFFNDCYKKLLIENNQYKEILDSLIKTYNININELNSNGEPLFFTSLLNFNFSLFKILRLKNLNLETKDINGNNIIFCLLKKDSIKMVENRRVLLGTIKNIISSGVSIEEINQDGLTALQFAILKNQEDIVKLLLELRANSSILDEKQRNLIHTAIFKDKHKYIKILNQYNPNILNQPDSFGTKPINYAAFMGKKDLVLELISLGATINNPHTKSPRILEFLKRYHKNILNLSMGFESSFEKSNLNKLAQNMILEFEIDISRN